MNFQTQIPALFVALMAAWCLASLCAYGFLLRILFATGGKVVTGPLGPPDAGLASFFITWFCWLTYAGFNSGDRVISNTDIISGAIHVTLIVLLITVFLRFRNIAVAELFGLRLSGVFKAAILAVPLLVAAFPLVSCTGAIMIKLMGAGAKQQELVQFFTDASNSGNVGPVISTMAFGVFLAPVAEEFIFRGYLYAVVKKYLGVIPAMILTAGLFAAIHLNLTSMPSLFILAICFTIAYEATGSILVPMAMHAVFNLAEFCLMLFSPHYLQ